MNRLIDYVKKIRIFPKVFFVMLLSMVLITVTITYSTLKMSENLFVETFSITNSKIVNQIKENIETFNDLVVLAINKTSQSGKVKSFLTEQDTNSLDMINSYYTMQIQMKKIQSDLDDESGITMIGRNNRYFSTNRFYWPINEEEIRDHQITRRAYEHPKRLLYHYDQLETETLPAIIASKALVDQKSDEIYGVIYVSLHEKSFKKMYENYTSDGNDVLIIDNNGKVISSNQSERLGEQDHELLKHIQNMDLNDLAYKNIKYDQKKHILLTEYLPTLDLHVVNLIDRELVMENIFDKKSIILIGLSITGIALFFLFIISRRLTKSLTSLVKQISTIPKTNFNHYLDGEGSYETDQLATSFNFMLDELHDYVDMLMESQKKERNAELAALQQQINPHFLYNTLASIKIMISQGDKEKSAEMINKLIALLQNTIGNISETNTVEQELTNMKNYTFINQARYGRQIRVNYYIAPDCLTNEIPKLIIQPFIENAFFHAFNKKSSGMIYIMIRHEEGVLVCEVNDNGDGMEINKKKKLPTYKNNQQLFSGIGVRNVHERIQLLYGESFGVEISSQIGEGTNVKIRLPIIESKDSSIT